jgi:hypothetical protein
MAIDLLTAFEYHSPSQIREALAAGESPTELIKGKTPIMSLIEMYTRTAAFADCLRVLLDAGASTGDPFLEALLLDDASALDSFEIHRKFDLECTYTSLHGVSALHVCAEYNSVRCARALLKMGMDVNTRADVDSEGLGGHTPLFHTVNSNRNYCRPMMELLLEAHADVSIRLDGLVWAGGFDWETVIYDVTPISYAQCGLIKQFQRTEEDTYSNIELLYTKKYGVKPRIRNVPNKYLAN